MIKLGAALSILIWLLNVKDVAVPYEGNKGKAQVIHICCIKHSVVFHGININRKHRDKFFIIFYMLVLVL
jgi:hypothetical protein